MAFDKVIDSAKLDAAMKATADSIRSKTGGSDKIQWNENSGFSGSIAGIVVGGTGTDTSDATATANDMAQGATAYVKGQKVNGTIPTPSGLNMEGYAGIEGFYPDHKELVLEKYVESDVLLRKGAWIGMRCNTNEFGDASPADVAKGKTFTSVNGLKVVGTAETETRPGVYPKYQAIMTIIAAMPTTQTAFIADVASFVSDVTMEGVTT